jgi:hypothetical protein
VITARFPTATIALVRNPQLEGNIVLEWRPRVMALVLVLVFIAVVMGVLVDDPGPLNWEW